jgi:DNA uptake protein ComE-like DNA-binding protein
MSRLFTTLPIVFALALIFAGCSAPSEESTAEYQAACHGPPLRTVEERNKAMEDGYAISRRYDCIDKASFAAVAQEQARWQAANTPEAIAKRQAEFDQQRQRDEQDRQTREAAAQAAARNESAPIIVLHNVDVNSATQADIANVISVGPEVAAQVVAERHKRRFADWPDLVNRVVGLSAAQTAVYASICGLSVNGKSLDGAPPNAQMAALIARKYEERSRK